MDNMHDQRTRFLIPFIMKEIYDRIVAIFLLIANQTELCLIYNEKMKTVTAIIFSFNFERNQKSISVKRTLQPDWKNLH